MTKWSTPLSLIFLLIASGCNSSVLDEPNNVQISSPSEESTPSEKDKTNVSLNEDLTKVEVQFNPDTSLDDNYIWMEGIIEQAEKTETGYRFTIIPWSQDPSITYKTLSVEANLDLQIIWSTSNEALSFEELNIDEITRLVRVDVLLDGESTDEYPTGKITLISLLVG